MQTPIRGGFLRFGEANAQILQGSGFLASSCLRPLQTPYPTIKTLPKA
jgi:hypothetical protein